VAMGRILAISTDLLHRL